MRAGSTVVAVHAVGPAESRSATPDIDQLVRQACLRVGCPNVLIGRSIFEAGPPAETLLRVAERVGGDLLVIGRRGLGTAASSLGSTSEAVLDAADIPVLIVPRVCSPVEITSATLSGSAACPSARSVGLVE
jgi:nucleotide-binding universal stress UspA family protein